MNKTPPTRKQKVARIGSCIATSVVLSAMGFVFNLMKTDEPFQTISQALLWFVVVFISILAIIDYIALEKEDEQSTRL